MTKLTHLKDKINDREIEVQQSIKSGSALTSKAIAPLSEESGTIQETPFINQGTGTNNNTEKLDTSPVGKQLEKQGNTIVYNQLEKVSSTATYTTAGITAVYNMVEGTVTLNGTSTSTATHAITFSLQDFYPTIGHQYLSIISVISGSMSGGSFYCGYGNNAIGDRSIPADLMVAGYTNYYIRDARNSSSQRLVCYDYLNDTARTFDNLRLKLKLIDLTKWFNGDIPQDLLDHPEHFGWYYNGDLSYNTGEIKNCAGRYLVCGGRNIYNPTETYNRVIPNIEYYYYSSTAAETTITYYDNNQNLISAGIVSSGNTFTTPRDCVYINSSVVEDMTVSEYYTTGDVYNENYPYEESKIYDTGTEVLRRAGNAKDIKSPNGTITQKIGIADLGSLNWVKVNDSDHYYWFSTGITSLAKGFDFNIKPNIMCSKYDTENYGRTLWFRYGYTNRSNAINIYNNCAIYIYDEEFDGEETTAEEFKNSLSGVVLYYELKDSVVIQGTQFSENIQIDDYGSMTWLDTESKLIEIPQGTKLFYPADYVLLIDSLNAYASGAVDNLMLKIDITPEEYDRQNTALEGIKIGNTLYRLIPQGDIISADELAIGTNSIAKGQEDTVIGHRANNNANGYAAVLIGNGARNTGRRGIVVGNGAANSAENGVVIGKGAVNGVANAVSFDGSGFNRTIQLKDLSKIFFRNAEIQSGYTSFSQYPNGKSLEEYLLEKVSQYSTLPEASQLLLDRVVQYVGNSFGGYISGAFYICSALGTDPETYGWKALNNTYDSLDSTPIINQDLDEQGFTPAANTYYRHTGITSTYTNGKIYTLNSANHLTPLSPITVVDDLNSSANSDYALSARQGQILNQKIQAHITARSYNDISAMISALNAETDTPSMTVGFLIYLRTLGVPDVWVSNVTTYSVYTYTTDDAFVNGLKTNNYVQVGFYQLSMLETAKVDLTDYLQKATFPTGGIEEADIYAVANTQQQVMLKASSTVTTQGFIPRYTADGTLISSDLPHQANGQTVTNKNYVDSKVNDKIKQVIYDNSIFAATNDSDTANLGKLSNEGLIDILFSGHVTKVLSVLLSIDGTLYPCVYYSNGTLKGENTTYHVARLDLASGRYTLDNISKQHGITFVVNYYD